MAALQQRIRTAHTLRLDQNVSNMYFWLILDVIYLKFLKICLFSFNFLPAQNNFLHLWSSDWIGVQNLIFSPKNQGHQLIKLKNQLYEFQINIKCIWPIEGTHMSEHANDAYWPNLVSLLRLIRLAVIFEFHQSTYA